MVKKYFLFLLFISTIASCKNIYEEKIEEFEAIILKVNDETNNLINSGNIGKKDTFTCSNTPNRVHRHLSYLSNKKVEEILKPLLNRNDIDFVFINHFTNGKSYVLMSSVPDFCDRFEKIGQTINQEKAYKNKIVYQRRSFSTNTVNALEFYDGVTSIIIILK